MNKLKPFNMKFLIHLFVVITLSCSVIQGQGGESFKNIADEIKQSLMNEVVKVWYPKVLDSKYGGFLSDFDYKWNESGLQNKMLVSQARHIWTLSKTAEFLDDNHYKIYAEKGFDFLKNKMWDYKNGGFYQLINRKGNEIPNSPNDKSSYSISFSIYALSAYYKVSNDSSALDLAKKAFLWLEENAHDKVYKGYYDQLTIEGKLRKIKNLKNDDSYFVDPHWKDQNSSIHLLEAFTELYSVWPDSLLKERLSEMLTIIRDVIVKDKKHLTLFLKNDWEPISFRDSSSKVRDANIWLDHVSFGHDVETAFLMLEASHTLGIEHDKKTLAVAKSMIDHSLKYGWDNEKGGFYYMGYYFKDEEQLKIIDSSKVWWVQAEGLNSLLLMSKLFPNDPKYLKSFYKQWEYIRKYMIDNDNGGWFEKGLDNDPKYSKAPKAHVWKTTYHNARALMNCVILLNKLNND